MTMPIMRDSKLSDAWLQKVVADNPPRVIPENGNIFTGPVRLSFVELWEPQHPMKDVTKPKVYSAAMLWTPLQTQMVWEIIWPVIYNHAAKIFPANIDPQTRQPFGLHFPLHPQEQKPNYTGYTRGALYAPVSSKFKPSIVDASMNPVVDEARLYSGVWAICACNVWDFNQQVKKGVSLGIQSVMIIADDQPLSGGGSNPTQDFAGARVSANYDPAAAFGSAPVNKGAPPLPPGAVLPPATTVGYPAPLTNYSAPAPMPNLASMLDDEVPY